MPEIQDRPKKKKRLLLFFIIICIALFLLPYIKEYTAKTSRDGQIVTITIPEGASASSVAQMLEDNELVKTKYTFLLKYRLNRDLYPNIYPGEFQLHKGMALGDILKKLTSEYMSKETVTLTVPEGFTIEMIALRCQNLNLCSEADFISAVDAGVYDYEFIKYIPNGNYRHKLEGFLFPDTYEFFADASAVDIVDTMLQAFENAYLSTFSTYDDMFENVIIASMIEREAAVDSERATISGVIQNRLSLPMKLQLDATAVYAKTNGYYDIETPTGGDVRFDSPYNTYICDALPPGPICCPGTKSIVAAANPEQHDYYYYHTDTSKDDGSHIFTENYSEHNATMR